MRSVRWGAVAAFSLDLGIFAAGLVAGGMAIAPHVGDGVPVHAAALLAIPLVALMGRYPLVLTNRAGDAVIGFEASVLVFLVCSYSASEALAIWSIGMVVEHGFEHKNVRVRMFNIGLTITGGVLLVGVVTLGRGMGVTGWVELAVVVAACALYFAYDVVVTAVSLALEAAEPISSALQWRTMPLGLLCFIGVDTMGYLAVLLERSAPGWTLLLLVVPIGTMLLSVHLVGRAQLSQQRLGALFAAATHAPEWDDDERMERELLAHATSVLRHTRAMLRPEPPGPAEIGCLLDVSGSDPRYLVVRRTVSAVPFDGDDRRALEALTALGVASVNRHRLTDQMTHLAGHDPLTGLANRRVFADDLDQALDRDETVGVAVLFCDLDGFKAVNDRFGHHSGDALLVQAADRLRGCLRAGDQLARLGGDEFAVLLPEIAHESKALEIAAAIHDAFVARFVVEGGEVSVGVSVGVAYAITGDVGTDVLRNADTAMYRAKSLGKGRTEQFEALMRIDVLNRLELEEQLRGAIEARALTVVYQPIVDLRTGAVEGFEALSRWTHPTLGSISPDTFIPTAERLGLIAALDDQVLVKAHAEVRQLMCRTGARLSLSVNIAPSQVGDPALLQRVTELIASEPTMPLTLELTEQSLLADDVATVDALRRLTETGAHLAVDDFGVGYSSIGYLHRLPVDRVKIDKSLVQDLAVRRSYLLVQGVVAMARAMDLQVVVEGIEDAHTAVLLRDLGCDRAQGYLFGQPMPLRAAEALVRLGVAPGWAASVELSSYRTPPAPVAPSEQPVHH